VTPRVSVVVPVHNGAAHLGATLDALLAQTFADFELVVVDDGSSDGSGEVVRARRDPRIRLLVQENRGLCGALNRAIAEARAPLVARNDQDDVSRPQRLARQLEALEQRPDALAVYSQYTKFGARRRWSNADKQEISDGSAREVDPSLDGCLLGSTMLARTDALRDVGGFRQECYPCDDYDLQLRLGRRGPLLLLREPLVAYRFHAGANTYRLFHAMQERSRWVEDSALRRGRGEPELSFEAFVASRRLGLRDRVAERRLDLAKLQMRRAGQEWLDGRDVAAAGRAAASLLLDPSIALRRARWLCRRALALGSTRGPSPRR
jgi:glycosyltransferase involved in cell wall biosynthesis